MKSEVISLNKFMVGDRVIIREYDDMKEEFGVDQYGAIECTFSFNKKMKYLCGKTGTITFASAFGNYRVSFDDGTSLGGWSISDDMLELIGNGQDESVVPLCDKIKFEDIL